MWEEQKRVQKAQKAIEQGQCPAEALPELKPVLQTIGAAYADVDKSNLGVGSTIFRGEAGETVLPASRRPPVRRYWAAGPILPMNMPPRDTAPT